MRKLFIILLFIAPTSLFAQDFLPDKPGGFVNDYADILTASEERILETKLSNYRDTTTNAIVVATIESLQGYSIEEVATNLFNQWDIQYENRANGVLLLVSENDRAIRIEVGYGLEGAIPDLIAGRIISEVITPQFRAGSYFGGIDLSTTALMQLAAGEYEGNLTREREDEFDPFPIILFIIIMILLFTRRGRRRRSFGPGGFIYWGGGGSSNWGSSSGSSSWGGGGSFGGFGGGGGFSSGGGGASGGW